MNNTCIGNERRSHKRLRVNCTVIYRANEPVSARFITRGKDIEARMLDVSQGGMAMVTGEVRSNVPLEKDEHRLGIWFRKVRMVSVVRSLELGAGCDTTRHYNNTC